LKITIILKNKNKIENFINCSLTVIAKQINLIKNYLLFISIIIRHLNIRI